GRDDRRPATAGGACARGGRRGHRLQLGRLIRMAWCGWLSCSGCWRLVCRGPTLNACCKALVAIQEAAGGLNSLHGVLTGGAPPTFPPPADPCQARTLYGPRIAPQVFKKFVQGQLFPPPVGEGPYRERY